MVHTIFALLLFLFPLAYSPGPGNMFFAANGARFGFWSTLRANVGYHIATWIVTIAIGFGFLTALDNFPQIFAVLKIAGSLYVLWIAWNLFKAGAVKQSQAAKPPTFTSGIVLLVLNPKAYVIIALMFTQFLDRSAHDHLRGIFLIASVFTLNNLVAFLIWTVIGDSLARLFRTPETARKMNMVFGAILAAVALWMILS